jgi:SagB-type dehydrogenase family enzyme
MTNSETELCRDYEAMVFERLTTTDPRWVVLPSIDWEDQPSRFKVYQGAELHPLPVCYGRPLASFGSVLSSEPVRPQPLTSDRLSQLLLYTNGILGRKMDLNWNSDNFGRLHISGAAHTRGPASGGGMYPFEIYYVAGTGGTVTPGIYHYDTAHHSLARICTGDWTSVVRRATLDSPIANEATDFFLVTDTFWKSSFKYASFTYHLVAVDTGLCLSAAHLTGRALGVPLSTVLWFSDLALDGLLGLDPLYESVFAVIAVRDPGRCPLPAGVPAGATPGITLPFFQRSRRIVRFPIVEQVHQASFIDREERPDSSVMAGADIGTGKVSGEPIALPAVLSDQLDQPLDRVFRARRSSFGSFNGSEGIGLAELGTVLSAAVSAHEFAGDMKPDGHLTRFTRISVMAQHVRGLKLGVYDYEPGPHALIKRSPRPCGQELQSLYFLDNYNLEQAAVAFLILADLDRMFQAFGSRGLRIAAAEVGSVCQHIYLACAALGLGCGALFGFDNVAMRYAIGLENGEDPMLLMAAGREHAKPEGFDYRIY